VQLKVLVVWIAYCVAFKAAKSMHHDVMDARVALDFNDLEYLVLSDKESWDALLGLASF